LCNLDDSAQSNTQPSILEVTQLLDDGLDPTQPLSDNDSDISIEKTQILNDATQTVPLIDETQPLQLSDDEDVKVDATQVLDELNDFSKVRIFENFFF